ncbi:hypothetical protein ABEF95_006083 [Exophiala dermatitidis]
MRSTDHHPRLSSGVTSTSAALRRGDIKISDPIPFDEPRDSLRASKPGTRSFHSYGHQPGDATWLERSSPTQDLRARHASDAQTYAGARNSLAQLTLPRSMSSMPSKVSLDQKRTGGLRAVLKRMFSGKRHRSAPISSSVHQYHNHGQLNTVAEQHAQMTSEPAPPSRRAALGSHSMQQETKMAEPSSTGPPRRRRRNTLPSLVFEDNDSRLAQLMVRSSAKEASLSDKRPKEDCVSDGQLNRRSKSADALNDLMRKEGIDSSPNRDRADEITFWRNSAIQNPVPVYSGQSIAVDPEHILNSFGSAVESDQQPGGIHPLQSFEFGLNCPARDSTTIEDRVNTLEVKLIDFEYALAKLQGNNITKPVLHSQAFDLGSIHSVFPDDNIHKMNASASSPDFGYFAPLARGTAFTFLASPGESALPSPEGHPHPSQRASRATTATIRPVDPSRRSAERSQGTSASSFPVSSEILLRMIQEEKAARQRLERQVAELQKELDGMRSPIYATIREAYSPPSPESSHNTSTPRTLHRSPGFQMNHPPPEVSRFSGTDPDTEPEQSFKDVYGTPNESRNTFETARGSVEMAVI